MDSSEARKILIENFSVPQISGNSEEDTKFNIKMQTAFNMALQALEIIDKIRAEIDVARFIDKDTKLCKNANASGLEVALQIINKHISESEG